MSKQNFCLLKASRSNVLFMLSCALIILFGFAVILPTVPANTFAEGDTPSEGIAITVSDSVSANVVLFDEGDYKIAKDTVSVSSSAAYGYELFLTTDSEAHQSIYLNDDPTSESRIAPVSGTIAEPATLTNNTWGFAIAGQGNFDDSYDPTNPDPASRFAIIPTADNQQAVFENNAATAEDNVDFYYGVKVEPTLEPGEYKTSAEYTAIAKEPPLTAKAILGENGNLNFLYDRTIYNVGDTYTDNLGETTISNVYEAALNGISEDVRPWAAQSDLIITANFDSSFIDATPTSLTKWFRELRNLKGITNLDYHSINSLQVTDTSYMFDHTGYNVTTPTSSDRFVINFALSANRVTDASYMFAYAGYSASRVEIQPGGIIGNNSLRNISHIFDHAGYNATSFDLNHWSFDGWSNLRDVDASYAFAYTAYSLPSSSSGASRITLPSYFRPTSTSHMFDHAFYTAQGDFALVRLETWEVYRVTDMSYMFAYAFYSNRQPFNLSLFPLRSNVAEVDLSYMFDHAGCSASSFTLSNLQSWQVSRVTNMSHMFDHAGYDSFGSFDLGQLGGWDVSRVTDMSYMFDSAGYRSTTWNIGNISNWNVAKITNHEGFINLNIYDSNASVVNNQPNWPN